MFKCDVIGVWLVEGVPKQRTVLCFLGTNLTRCFLAFVGDIWKLFKRYEREVCSQASISIQFYPFIYRIYEAYDSDTDVETQDTDKFWDDPTANTKLSYAGSADFNHYSS